MSSKRKLSKQEKYLRRIKEVSKASQNSEVRGLGVINPNVAYVNKPSSQSDNKVLGGSPEKLESFSLPIAEIKKDLWKNVGFSIVSFALVVLIRSFGLDMLLLKHWFQL